MIQNVTTLSVKLKKHTSPLEPKFPITASTASLVGGLHHVPSERLDPFIDSMSQNLRPGGVLLFRDHDMTHPGLHAIASVVHSFVNAANKTPWEVEKNEIRAFKSAQDWTALMEKHQFIRIFT